MEENFSHDLLDLDRRNAIRLIELLPSSTSGDDTIRCRLMHATTDILYDCLSYVWGTDEPRRTIFINDRPFRVRENLWHFLKSATEGKVLDTIDDGNLPEPQHRLLWIDALCIDQQNVLERNHQVQQMGKIYRDARHVLAWLGESSSVVDFIESMKRIEVDVIEHGSPIPLLWKAMSFCEHAYWRRAWITQEVSLARDLCIAATKHGSITGFVHCSSLASKLSAYLSSLDEEQVHSDLQPLSDLISRQSRSFLIENLWRYRHKKCQDQRDLVYSLVSISGVPPGFKVNYNLTTSEVAIQLIRSLGDQFCMCYSKMTLQSFRIMLLSGEDDQPFATVRMKPMPIENHCEYCQEYFWNPHAVYRMYFETWRYCLRCTRHKSIVQSPGDEQIIRNGHILILHDRDVGAIIITEAPWIDSSEKEWESLDQLSKKSQGVRVLNLDEHGQVTLQLSIGFLEKLAAIPFSADFRAQNDQTPGRFTEEVAMIDGDAEWELLDC